MKDSTALSSSSLVSCSSAAVFGRTTEFGLKSKSSVPGSSMRSVSRSFGARVLGLVASDGGPSALGAGLAGGSGGAPLRDQAATSGVEWLLTLTVVNPSSWEISLASAKSFGAYSMRAARLFIMVSAALGPYASRNCDKA